MSESVTIVVPVWKSELSRFEEISLRQSFSILDGYEFSLVTYRGLDLGPVMDLLAEYGIKYRIVYFSKRSFASVSGYNQLMLSARFYRKFLRYKYILIYQQDCFVFSDELPYWLTQEYSYIGAPWLEGLHLASENSAVMGVGNGGFSLRHVRNHLRVLLSFHYLERPFEIFKESLASPEGTFLGKLLSLIRNLTIRNNTFFLFNTWSSHEDFFWSNCANDFSWFSVPKWEIAARFSVEVHPRRFISKPAQLPFGCHAWWSYDLDFWKPFIERFGHKLT